MSSQSELLTNVQYTVLNELIKRKTFIRALKKIHDIFDNRTKDLCEILSPYNRIHSDDDFFSWNELFDGLHEAIKIHCKRIVYTQTPKGKNSLISKNGEFKEAFRKCINLANPVVPNVSYTKICQAAFECLETPTIYYHFDELYVSIVLKHILNAKHSISELRVTDWSRKFYDQIYGFCLKKNLILWKKNTHFDTNFCFKGLLSYIFRAYDQEPCRIPKLQLLQCIVLILRRAPEYTTHLAGDLQQYLPNITRIVDDEQLVNQINAKDQTLNIVYEYIRNVCFEIQSSDHYGQGSMNLTSSAIDHIQLARFDQWCL